MLGHEQLTELITTAWSDVLGEPPASPDEGFFEAGGTSLLAVRLLDAVGSASSIHVDLRRFLRRPSFGELVEAAVLDEAAVPPAHYATGRTVVRLRRTGRDRLWCFMPPLSGAVTMYGSLARLLPPRDAVWACESPADLSTAGMTALTTELAAAVAEAAGDDFGVVAVAGYSLGGTVAFEVARRLRWLFGARPVRVDALMIDPPRPVAQLASFEKTFEIFVRKGWRLDRDPAGYRDASGRPDFGRLAAAARAAGGLPAGDPDSTVADAWTVYEANSRLLAGYSPVPLPGPPAALYRSSGRTARDADSWSPIAVPELWSGAVDPNRCAQVDLDHYSLLAPPHDVLAARWLAESVVDGG